MDNGTLTTISPAGACSGSSCRAYFLHASGWLALILVVAKAATWDAPWAAQIAQRLLLVLTTSWQDVAFALSCGAVADLIMLAAARGGRTAAITRGALLALFAIFSCYAIVAIGFFRYFNRPLTYYMFGLVGHASALRSSIAERLTPSIGLALLLAPALFLLLAIAIKPRARLMAVMLLFWSVWAATGWALYREPVDDQQSPHLVLSPHVELLRTIAVRAVGADRRAFPSEFPPSYADEFRSFGGRDETRRAHFALPDGVPRPKNVILIVLESVGTKYLGLYGHAREVTPVLTAESRHALVFDNIYAHASFTYASFRPINFSVYPGLPWHYSLLRNRRPLPQTLAGAMKARGARTAYITSGDLDWGDQRWLLERSEAFDLLEGANDLPCPLLSSWGTEDRCAVDRLIEWIDREPARPFFAICWTDQTHDPFLPSPGTMREDLSPAGRPRFAADLARYLSILRNTDAQLARVFALLRERGIADDTLVVITGDHGEAFADPHSQRGHAWTVYDEEVKVPLLLWNPRLFPGGARSSTVGGHVDLNPTLGDLLGIEPSDEWQGYSLFDSDRPPRAFLMAIAGGDVFGVREENWKFIFDVTSGRERLFNLAEDPGEQRDVVGSEAERARVLRERVAAFVAFEDAFLWGRRN